MRLYMVIVTVITLYHINCMTVTGQKVIPTPTTESIIQSDSEHDKSIENDGESSKKIIGSSVVTSVSVVLNGDHQPQFTDAIGKPIPKPMIPPLQVASPINLLNPDRYEFYTFDDNGELVKRLMTLKEIQSIVANGDGEGATIIHNMPINDRDPEKNVHDIVASVQNVLTKEVEWKKNSTSQPVLDTPDVSASWSMILPTIFGNTGGEIFPSVPQKVVMTPETDVVDTSTKSTTITYSQSSPAPSEITQKPKLPPRRRPSTKKPLSVATSEIPQKVFVNNQEYLKPIFNRVDSTSPKPLFKPFPTMETSVPVSSLRPRPTVTTVASSTTSHKPRPPASSSASPQPTSTTVTTFRPSSSTLFPSSNLRPISIISTSPTSYSTRTNTTPSSLSTVQVISTTKKRVPIHTTATTGAITSSTSVPSVIPTKISTTSTAQTTSRPFYSSSTLSSPSTSESAVTMAFSPILSTERVSTSSTSEMAKPQVESLTEISESQISHDDNDLNNDQTTTLSINNIINSLTQTQEDENTKLSFDQIMESLKGETTSNEEKLPNVSTVITNQIQNNTTIHPIMYSGSEILINHETEDTNEKLPQAATTTQKHKPQTDENLENDEEMNSYMTTTEYEFDGAISEESNSEKLHNNSNVVHFEPLFVEIKEPILVNITTTESSNSIQTTNWTEDDENENETSQPEIEINNAVANENNNNELPKPIRIDLHEGVKPSIGQEIHNFISNALNQTQRVQVSTAGNDLSPMSMSLTSGNISMSDFKQQAATLASTIESSISTEHPAIVTIDASNEIEALLSDVLNQITDSPSTTYPIKNQITHTQDISNRLSGFAQINSALFAPSSSSSSSQGSEKYDIESSTSSPSSTHTSLSAANRIVESETESSQSTERIKTTLPPTSEEMDYLYTTGSDSIEEMTKSPSDDYNKEDETSSQGSYESVTESIDQEDEETESVLMVSTTPQQFVESSDEEDLTQAIQNMLIADDSKKNDTLEEHITLSDQIDSNTSHMDEQMMTTDYPEDSTLSAETQYLSVEQKEEEESLSHFSPTPITDIFNITETEQVYIKLGESTQRIEELKNATPEIKFDQMDSEATTPSNEVELSFSSSSKHPTSDQPSVTTYKPILSSNQKQNLSDDTRMEIIETTLSPKDQGGVSTLKPVQYYKQPGPNDQKLILFFQRPGSRPPALSNLKVNQVSQVTRSPVKLDPTPEQMLGLEESTVELQEDIQEFARLCNELAFSYWKSITSEKISPARSLVLSPFALTSMLSMVFLGARGGTSGEMNEILKLDDMVTFNPHLIFKNITESVEHSKDSNIASAAFVREIFSDRNNGKILQFFREKTQQLYSGHVEEVNFNVVNDIIRRRTNLLMKRHTMGKVAEYLRTNSVWVNGPLATVSANLFQTDCSRGSTYERDGEMFFQVHPSVRQRRLVPIPAVVWRSGFSAGYDPELDATVVAFGSSFDTVSTIYLMPGQQGLAAPGDNLDRLEKNLLDTAISKNSWSRLLTSLMERPGLEVQLPRFSHRSFINASLGLQKMGLKALFNSDAADLRGLTGSSHKDVYLSDMVQINTFSTCAEEKITDHHHIEMYPAPPLRRVNADIEEQSLDGIDSIHFDFDSLVQDNGRAFYDDLLDPKYLELPLPLRPRQARIPDAPRLRYDKPFLYFVRHNPTGMILFMGRFNPRLLP